MYTCVSCGVEVLEVGLREIRNHDKPGNSMCPECALSCEDEGIDPEDITSHPEKYGF